MALLPAFFLVLSALNQQSTATSTENSTGLNFIIAFPENIAYYYPTEPENKIQVTALHHDTVVTITPDIYPPDTKTLNAGLTQVFPIDARMELGKEEISSKTLRITSTKSITVHAINQKKDSVQTALVMSTDNLGKEYHIPPVPKIKGTTEPATLVSTEVTERGPFKLIVINSDQENEVTMAGAENEVVNFQPYQLRQFWVTELENVRDLKAKHPVAVLFGHPCATLVNCTCGMLFTPLSPVEEGELKFFIPPFLAENAESETFLLLSDKASQSLVPFSPTSSLMTTSGTVVLYRPGILLSLIPEKEFASCYVISSITNIENIALLVVRKDQTDGVRLGKNPLTDPDWKEVKGTEYVSTDIELEETGKTVIWHTSSKMAVYYIGKKEDAFFGNPAASISKDPDFRGCVLSQEVMEIGDVAKGWPESVKYCEEKDLQLVSPDTAQLQKHISTKLSQVKTDKLEHVWIGLRRSSLTGQWYWVSGAAVNETKWDQGEPGTVQDGQCAMMTLDTKKDFGWRDEDCCKTAFPVCYRDPVLLPM